MTSVSRDSRLVEPLASSCDPFGADGAARLGARIPGGVHDLRATGCITPDGILLDPAQPDHASAGLKAVSLLRLHKLATIHETDIVRQVGVMSASLWADVETKLRLLLNL